MRESKAQLNKRVGEILERLDSRYGTGMRCFLTHNDAWELLVAVILSAQCTDERVNTVTPALFAAYPTPKELGDADVKNVEKLIHSVGFYRNKAKNIVECSRVIDCEYGGKVPASLEELTALPGVGRKTANVIRGNVYNDPSIVVDTHVKRISRLLGFTKQTDPEKVEYDLMKLLPKDHWIVYNLHIITLGRSICTARRPACGECFLNDLCPSAAVCG